MHEAIQLKRVPLPAAPQTNDACVCMCVCVCLCVRTERVFVSILKNL